MTVVLRAHLRQLVKKKKKIARSYRTTQLLMIRRSSRRGATSVPTKPGGVTGGAELVGKGVRVYWPMERRFFTALIVAYDAKDKSHHLAYLEDSGNVSEEWRRLVDFVCEHLADSEEAAVRLEKIRQTRAPRGVAEEKKSSGRGRRAKGEAGAAAATEAAAARTKATKSETNAAAAVAKKSKAAAAVAATAAAKKKTKKKTKKTKKKEAASAVKDAAAPAVAPAAVAHDAPATAPASVAEFKITRESKKRPRAERGDSGSSIASMSSEASDLEQPTIEPTADLVSDGPSLASKSAAPAAVPSAAKKAGVSDLSNPEPKKRKRVATATAAAAASDTNANAAAAAVAVAAAAGSWKMTVDPTSGRSYFYNTSTGKRQWQAPREVPGLPADVVEAIAAAAHAKAAKAAKAHAQPGPAVMDALSAMLVAADSSSSSSSSSTSTAAPAVAPALVAASASWKSALDPNSGKTYWYNLVTKKRSWDAPPGGMSAGEVGGAAAVGLEGGSSGAASGAAAAVAAAAKLPQQASVEPAPSTWKSTQDPSSGKFYWYNLSTGERSWTAPPLSAQQQIATLSYEAAAQQVAQQQQKISQLHAQQMRRASELTRIASSGS